MGDGLEIIGAGFGRTGTLSLKTALEQLGFSPCHHMQEVMTSREQVDHWHDACESAPASRAKPATRSKRGTRGSGRTNS